MSALNTCHPSCCYTTNRAMHGKAVRVQRVAVLLASGHYLHAHTVMGIADAMQLSYLRHVMLLALIAV